MFEKDELVWARSGVGRQIFWPAKVINEDQVLTHRKMKHDVVCVQFLAEGTSEAITDSKKLLPFHCKQKNDFLKKGRGQIDPHKICQFDSAVKQAEQQIKSSKIQSNTIYSEAVKTTTNRFEASSVGKDPATDLPKVIDFPKNSSAELKSDKFCKILEGKNSSNTLVRKRTVSKRLKMPSTRGTKRPFDSNEKGNGPNVGKDTCKRGKKNKIGKNVKKNVSSLKASISKKCFSQSASVSAKKQDSFCDNHTSAGKNESVSDKYLSGEKSNVSRFQPSMDFSINLNKLNTETHPVVQNKYGTNYSINENNGTDISTSIVNGVSQGISNGNHKLDKIVNQDGGVEKVLSYDDDLKKDSEYELETSVNNYNSNSEDELPEAFSSSPAECSDFHSGDLVWAKFRKTPYWPAQINKVMEKRYHGCSVFFLPRKYYRSLKVKKKNMVPFSCDKEIFERYKNQEIEDVDKDMFDLALKEAEDILVRKASGSKKVDVPIPEDEGISDNGSSISTEFKEPCENNGRDELAERLDNKEEESVPLKTPERRRSQRERRSVSKYNEILLQFHCCKSKLVKIFQEKVRSDRHQKFRYGTVAEKDYLKRKSGFGPIQDEEICDKIIKTLQTWYNEIQETTIPSSYIYDVWLPEAIIYFIMNNENIKRDEAEEIYLDPSRNVSKKDADDLLLCFKNRKIDESAKQECLERAKRAFRLP